MYKIFVNGTFDVIHRGHIQLLNYAKSFGTHLLVAIDTDERVKKLKGITRPVNNQNDRLYFLSNLKAVDSVFLFDSDKQLISIIKTHKPDIMVKGKDYEGKYIIGKEYFQQVLFYDYLNDYSTTKLIKYIKNHVD